MRSINLIPTARRDAKRRRLNVRRCATAAAIYAVVVLAGGVTARFALDRHDPSVDAAVAKLAREVGLAERELAATEAELKAAHSAWRADRTVAGQPDWSALFALLSEQVGDDVVLRGCQLAPVLPVQKSPLPVAAPGSAAADASPEPTEYIVTAIGLARTQISVSQFVLRLERSGVFERVALLETNREPYLGGEAIVFKLECSLAEGARPGTASVPPGFSASPATASARVGSGGAP